MALLGPLAAVAQAASLPVSFAPRTDLPAGTSPQSVALDDLNNDGVLDLVVANRGWLAFGPGELGSVSVSLGDGAGGFGARIDYDLGAQVLAVAVADLDGDTVPDLIVSANGGIGKVWTLLGDGAGDFAPPNQHIAGSTLGSGPFAVADLDGDGDSDIAVADPGAEAVQVLLGTGDGELGDPVDFVVGGSPFGSPNSVVAADLNNDSILDLATSNDLDAVSVLLGHGDGTFSASTEIATAPGSQPRGVTAADVNGDGVLDLVTANPGGGSVSRLLGNGDATFGPEVELPAGAGARSVAVSDLNADTFPDLAVASFAADSVSVLAGDGAGGFASPVDFATGWGPDAVAVGDLDGDGGPDVVAANATNAVPAPDLGDPNPGPGSVSVLMNTTPTVPPAPTIGAATAADGRATVSWTAPAFDGGSAITGYVVTPYVGYWSGAPRVFSSTATTQTVTGLANGWRYRFRVQGVNAVGTGPHSTVTNPVTPSV